MPAATAQSRGRRNRRAGTQREQEWADRLFSEGWEVSFRRRSRAEREEGREQPFDLIATRGGEIVLWEVKSTQAGPFSTFGPAKRKAVRSAASRSGGVALLCWWPFDRAGPRVIPEEKWPR